MRSYLHCVILLISVSGALIVTAAALGRRANGQEAASPDSAAEKAKRAERLEEMDQIAASIRLASIDGDGSETPAVMSEQPLLRWTDPTREFSDGGLWVWRVSGRPVAVVGIELYFQWSLEFVSLSTGLVKAEESGVRWAPRTGGVEFKEIPDAPAPAADESGRLRQMHQLAKRFAAREYWVGGNGQHYALRLLPHPVDRYSDPGSGVVDGGLFIFAHGTNPEVLMMVEARKSGAGPARWSFAAAPLSHAEVALKIGLQDVWTSPSKDPPHTISAADPYFDVLTPRRVVDPSRTGKKQKPPK
ncbi:hypothetical protein [Paludisphaera borealis]|uniref:Uncharacterized protein n=1 Tax=Paludisphaera borealis TaxID=1387353 RepID=A0A1U7CJU7_9BACT|nr:hypothetical protein [Paludisphaera borealis]APW59177.1 hypothetical protein BSF38_00591 [Paludisphaera borealis]